MECGMENDLSAHVNEDNCRIYKAFFWFRNVSHKGSD